MKTRILALAFVAILAGAASASAQLRAGTVEINPFAGYLFGGQFGRSFDDSFDRHNRLEVDDDAVYGGRLGFNLTSLFEIEFEYAQSDTALVFDDRDHHVPDDRIGDLRFQYFMGYATFNFGRGRFVPYFTVGSGAAHIRPHISGVDTDSDTRYTASLGGGLKYFFNPHFALRFDGRAYSSYLGDSEVVCRHSHSSDCRQTNWVSNGVANGGFILAF